MPNFCTQCGRAADDQQRFCTGCGSDLGASSQQPVSTPQTSGAGVATVQLTITDASGATQLYTLEMEPGTEIIVGRDKRTSTIHVEDSRASREHFSIKYAGSSFTLVDLGSSNGTLLGWDKIIGPTQLSSGDAISFGRSRAVFSVSGAS